MKVIYILLITLSCSLPGFCNNNFGSDFGTSFANGFSAGTYNNNYYLNQQAQQQIRMQQIIDQQNLLNQIRNDQFARELNQQTQNAIIPMGMSSY